MTCLQIELPDKLAAEIQRLIKAGWFETEQEIIRLALIEFIRRHEAALAEQFQLEDISWAVAQAKALPHK
jgi:Arc/MetJ-type ribon-helix-helix transcriptional regulator